MRRPHRLLLLLVASAACAGSPPALPVGQSGDLVLTRAELEQRLTQYEEALTSSQFSSEERQRITARANFIRQRLDFGDFRVGDRILLTVQGETALPDTAIVEPGQVITLEPFGEFSVARVLRSEITAHLEEQLGTYIREPQVRASGLVRVAVLGAVGQPGFYTMPAETLLGDAIMVAGGPSGNANVDQIRLRRGEEEIMDGEASRLALQQGLTLDQIDIQGGDQINVPQTRGFVRVLTIVTGVVGSLSFLAWRLF